MDLLENGLSEKVCELFYQFTDVVSIVYGTEIDANEYISRAVAQLIYLNLCTITSHCNNAFRYIDKSGKHVIIEVDPDYMRHLEELQRKAWAYAN